jgi:DNA-binding CsgD family transcriptional regulator
MYKNITIVDGIDVMMIMLDSLPISSIVFDDDAKLIKINKPAQNLLSIKLIEDCFDKEEQFFPEINQLHDAIKLLRRGVDITEQRIILRGLDGVLIHAAFSACMLYGVKKVFLFQFYELLSTTELHLKFLTNVAHYEVNTILKKYNYVTKDVSNNIYPKVFLGNSLESRLFTDITNQILQSRFPNLTHNEVVVCGLIASQMSIEEIAELTTRTPMNIRCVIYRIVRKLELKSTKALYEKMVAEIE